MCKAEGSRGGLEIGDSLQSHDGKPIAVEGVADSGGVETVYNFRIADYHTSFVGGDEWGFDVWAHNAGYGNSLSSNKPATLYELVDATGNRLKWGISNNPSRRYSQKYLQSINAELKPILSGPRRRMVQIERSLTLQEPGPMNHEPWAGAFGQR